MSFQAPPSLRERLSYGLAEVRGSRGYPHNICDRHHPQVPLESSLVSLLWSAHSAGLAETGFDYSAGDGGGGPGNFASQLIVTDFTKAT